MLTPKGRDEILKLIGSDLVEDWPGADRCLKQALRLLLSQRPDVIRLYFPPAVWSSIVRLDRPQATGVILAAMKATVVDIAGCPPVASAEQALFYMNTRITRYRSLAVAWCRTHPEHCPPALHAHLGTEPQLPSAGDSE